MRVAALAVAGRGLRIYNDHLDHFALQEGGVLWEHVKWRWSQRARGVVWWNALAALAILCGERRGTGRNDVTADRRSSARGMKGGDIGRHSQPRRARPAGRHASRSDGGSSIEGE